MDASWIDGARCGFWATPRRYTRQRTRELRAEAEQCIGELAYVVDEKTVVTVETPQGLPDTSTNPPVSPPVVVNPPVVTNPPPLSPIQ